MQRRTISAETTRAITQTGSLTWQRFWGVGQLFHDNQIQTRPNHVTHMDHADGGNDDEHGDDEDVEHLMMNMVMMKMLNT